MLKKLLPILIIAYLEGKEPNAFRAQTINKELTSIAELLTTVENTLRTPTGTRKLPLLIKSLMQQDKTLKSLNKELESTQLYTFKKELLALLNSQLNTLLDTIRSAMQDDDDFERI